MAIAKVAEDEYRRLSTGKSPEECLNHVKQALKSLGELQNPSGDVPKYNEWDALFYLTWYQPRQINLALAIVHDFFSDNSLHVIDVGCGALAVQIAAAVATAEKRSWGSKINITVQGIDPSEPMRNIGKKLWKEFCSIVDKNPRLLYLSQVCNAMTDSCDSHNSKDAYYCSADAHIGSGASSAECWLMAVHAVYDSNKDSLRDILADIRRKSAPMLEVVTSHSKKRDLAEFVAGGGFKEWKVRSKGSGVLPKTTLWRRRLSNGLTQQSPEPIVSNFLWPYVNWNPPQNDAVILFRKESCQS